MQPNYLKVFAAILIIAACSIGTSFAQPAAPAGKMWEKVNNLSDEFDTWDGTKWQKPLWNYGVPVQMAAGNSGVSDGNLWIKATLDNSSNRWFKTSRVMSNAQIKFPMYTECRMRTSHLSAFSTYWLNNGDSNNRDEIDICEHNSKPSWPNQPERPYTMYSQYFIVKNGVVEREHGNFDNRNLANWNPAKGKKWNEEYQILGCWWKDAYNVQFYINGEEAGSVHTTQAFTRNQNIIWDLWTSPDSWTGGIASQSDLGNDNINTMYVDWIHTYKLVNTQQFYIVNRESGKKLRVKNTTDGSALELVPASWTGNPTKWTQQMTDNGYFYLKNVSSNMYFRPTDDSDGSVLIQRPTSYNGSYTQWRRLNTGGDYFYLQNRSTGDYFRPASGNNYSQILQRPTSYTNNWTQWKFVSVSTGKALKSSSLAEKTLTPDQVLVYPNPAKGMVNVLLDPDVKQLEVTVMNMLGNVVLKDSFSENSVRLNVEHLSTGMYLLKVNTENGSQIKQLMIQ